MGGAEIQASPIYVDASNRRKTGMERNKTTVSGFLVGVIICASMACGSDFASEVVSYKGPFGTSLYDDPNSVLGKPTRWVYDFYGSDDVVACSLVFPAHFVDPNGQRLICTIGTNDINDINESAEIVVKFDHRVGDDPGNPYGIDFIVFGNSFFGGETDANVLPGEDMDEFILTNPATVLNEPVLVSVAQYPDGPWYTFHDGPYADSLFPTNAFAWDSNTKQWGEEQNWLRPVEPNLTLADFDGLSAADAIALYQGSAGGTGFDLKYLAEEDYSALAYDPNTHHKWIQYIKVQYLPGAEDAGEIDAFADVSGGCGDYKHPYPKGDINRDCIVNLADFAVVAENWLECTYECE